MSGPALDQPQTIEHDADLSEAVRFRLANQIWSLTPMCMPIYTIFFGRGPMSLTPAASALGSALRDEFVPLVTLFPAGKRKDHWLRGHYCEQAAGLADGTYDRSALWIFECQAEGDRLLRIDVEVD
ncbi:MAG: hypothetical protein R2911_17865 [Caldilineaceae bacterium]